MNLFLYQLKQAYLTLKHKPGFVSSVVITMGLTLGALLCVLTLAYVMLIKPLPYPEQDKLYKINSASINSEGEPLAPAFSYPGLIHVYKNHNSFSEAALIYYYAEVITSLSAKPRMNMLFVTPEWFTLLDAKMALGRKFEQTEKLDTNNPVIILTYETWQKEFAGDTNILNEKVTFDGTSYQVIGVLAKSYIEPNLRDTDQKTQLYMPWDYNRLNEAARKDWLYVSPYRMLIGKVLENTTSGQLEKKLTALENNIWQEKIVGMEFYKGWSKQITVESLKSVIIGNSETTVLLLLSAVIGLVVIACSNITNLFMSHIAAKLPQLTIHAAMGANKRQLFKGLLAESGLLMLMSIILALSISSAGFLLLQNYLSSYLPRVNELNLNMFTLLAAALIASFSTYFFAFISYKMINYRALNTRLQTSGKGTGIQISKNIRQLLIFSQIVVVTSLVFTNISLCEKAYSAITKSLGFNTDNIYRLELSRSASGRSLTNEEISISIEQVGEHLLQLPEIEQISHSQSPLTSTSISAQIIAATNERIVIDSKWIGPNYFNMINQTLIEGNGFNASHIKDKSRVLIINDVYAKYLSPQGSALGVKIIVYTGQEPYTVIGIVSTVTLPDNSEKPMRTYYTGSISSGNLMLQFKNNQYFSREKIIHLLADVSKDIIIYSYTSLNQLKETALFTQYVTALTSAVLALLTLALSAIGLFGILSYSTQIRRFEIGTRLAIGAKRSDLISLVLKDNAKAILLGILASVGVLLCLTLGFSEQLNEYLTLQLLPMFIMTLALISIISFAACYLPLRQYINQPAIFSLKGYK
ncbi:MAG: ABC transporter permease [Alteromonadaceae bacterium]|nr:ABC transporter permease [Alteromonadaceae bacterium]